VLSIIEANGFGKFQILEPMTKNWRRRGCEGRRLGGGGGWGGYL